MESVYQLHVLIVLNFWDTQPPGALWPVLACNGTASCIINLLCASIWAFEAGCLNCPFVECVSLRQWVDGSRKLGGLVASREYILYGHFDLDDDTTAFLGNFGHQSPSDAASIASQKDGDLKFIIDNTRNQWLPLTVRHTELLTPSCEYTMWSIVAVAERQTGRRCFVLFIYESEEHLGSMPAELFTVAMLSRSLCILQ